jgi:hypothetical protein
MKGFKRGLFKTKIGIPLNLETSGLLGNQNQLS